MCEPKSTSNWYRRYWVWLLLCVTIMLFAAIRFRLLQIPLERDEGEYAYMGQLLLKGVPPYSAAVNMKLPGTYAAYALIMAVFGQTSAGIHTGLLLVNAATIVLTFLLTKKLFGDLAGIIAGAIYGVLSIGSNVMGFAGHATHFVTLFAMGGILLLVESLDSGKTSTLFYSGLLLGLAFIMKQPGALLAIFGVVWLFIAMIRIKPVNRQIIIRKLGIYIAAAALPFIITCVTLALSGVFDKFWFWTFVYAKEYATHLSLKEGAIAFYSLIWDIVRPAIAAWILALFGMGILFVDKKLRSRAAFATSFLLFSFLAVCPGFYFRGHYFIVMLPAVAMLSGVAISAVFRYVMDKNLKPKFMALPIVLFIAAFALPLVVDGHLLFGASPDGISRNLYRGNQFIESIGVAEYIRKNSDTDDTVAVLGSEPQIYFYSERRSATSHIYMYNLMENQPYALKMQRQLITEVEKAKPKFLVFVATPLSWLQKPDSSVEIFSWVDKYIERYYKRVGFVDMISNEYTEYIWGDDAEECTPIGLSYMIVFQRKAGI